MTTYEDFVLRRDKLLEAKPEQTVRSLAEELVELLEEIAIHGSSGIGGDPALKSAQIDLMEGRIHRAIRPAELR